jgi:hypothetical protein
MLGCRIQLDGYDCHPGNPAEDIKYDPGETGMTWSDNGSPAHDDCSDGGNIELYATNDLFPVQSGGTTHVFVAVGAGTNPEFGIVNVSSVPDSSSSPAINSSSCGSISSGNSGWKRIGSYDFNSDSGTEEAANSVFARDDGNRAYISSNGTSDSKQFYILNTSDKSSPSFLSGSPSSGPSSGFYQGTGADGELYPRRSLTVFNGQRAVLVGRDGVSNGNNAQEYQVLNSSNEASPTYCGGIDFDQGFNDLTSVSEADGDNYVYMVGNTVSNELKIVEGGPDGIYPESGTFESHTLDLGAVSALNRITTTASIPANTTFNYQIGTALPINNSCDGAGFVYVGPDGTDTTSYTGTGGPIPLSGISGFHNPAQCIRYKASMSTSDFNVTPTLLEVLLNYSL